MKNGRIFLTLVAGLALTGLLLTACGSGSGPSGASASGDQTTGLSDAQVTELQRKIDGYEKLPEFVAPGDSIDPSLLKGKKVLNVWSSSAIPFCKLVGDGVVQKLKSVGIQAQNYENQGQTSEWVAGLESAINGQFDAVNLGCGIDPATLQPQLQQLKSAGIPVISAHSYDQSQVPADNLSAFVYAPYKLAGELEADWVILQTRGRANVLVVDDVGSDVSTPALIEGIKGEFAKYCPETCKVTYQSVAIPDWANKIGPTVAAELTRNPGLQYVIPVYDGMVQFVEPEIRAAGKSDKVKIATFNASPPVMELLQSGEIVKFQIGEDFNWLVGAITDQTLRVLLGVTPSDKQVAGVRVFDKRNAADVGTPPTFEKGYGDSAEQGFQTLWSGQ